MNVVPRICALAVVFAAAITPSQVPARPSLKDLKDRVTIYRDRYGIPHIIGETEQATFFGYGYAQAQDHLVRMMMQYRDVQGRLSEVLGESAVGGLPLTYHPADYRWGGDYLQRLLRTYQTVQERRSEIDPTVYSLLQSFADGVNTYIDEHRSELPAWIDRVSPEDIEALERGNYMRYYSIADALVELPESAVRRENLGSNHWAVANFKSASGHVMQVGEIHMPWSNRFQMYEAHLVTPGRLNIGGISWFGSPFFMCGFNPDLSWSISYNQPNIADAYEEIINPANSLQYLYDGKWRSIQKTATSFRVRTSDGHFSTISRFLYYTHHGPVVHFDPVHHRAYSVRLPNFYGVNYSKGLYDLMKTDSISSFRSVLAEQLIPRWNFLCTTKDHIYWVHNGVVPRRDPSYNWLRPVPGWTSKTEWKGYLPFSDNPQLLDPPSGFLQNSNNPPWTITRNSGIDPLSPTPYYYSYPVKAGEGEEAMNSRGERISGVLSRPNERFTLDQMRSLSFDTYILAADLIVPLLDNARERHSTDTETLEAASALHSWNRRTSQDSIAFTYLYFWAKAYAKEYGDTSFQRFNAYNRDGISADSRAEQERAWSALHMGVEDLKKTFGKSAMPWGEMNYVNRGEEIPLDGTGIFETLHPDYGPVQSDGRIDCDDGWAHIMLTVEGDHKQVWTLIPYGDSQDPHSPHYRDQALLHSQRKLKPFWLTAKEISENTESVWGDKTRISHADF